MDAKRVLEESIVVDGLYHTLFADPPPGDKLLVDHFLDGGLTAVNVTVDPDFYKNSFEGYCKEIYQFYVIRDTFPDKVIIATSVADIKKAKEEGKLAIIMGSQGADAFEHDLRYISILHKLGLRIVQITYNQKNNIGYGCFEPNDLGLGRFGQQAIYEMNRLGMVIDLSHVGYKTSMDAIEISTQPCIFSHSSVYNLCSHPRNIKDDQIKAVTAKGGVVGLCPHSVMNVKDKKTWPTVDNFIDHMVYVMDMCGEDSVAIGTDRWMRPTLDYFMNRTEFERTLPGFFGGFTGDQKHVKGFNYYDEWESLVESMLKRNITEDQVKKILGGNFMRVFNEVWGE